MREMSQAIPLSVSWRIPLDDPIELWLDPKDWKAFRRLAHKAHDEALEFVDKSARTPCVAAEIRAQLNEALPVDETPLETVYQQFRTTILPDATGNLCPRFFGWVHGPGQAGHIVAEMLADAMNSNCGPRPRDKFMSKEVLGWCKHLFGFPPEASGLIVTRYVAGQSHCPPSLPDA